MHGYTTNVFPYLALQSKELKADVTRKQQLQENDEADDDGIISSYCVCILQTLSWKAFMLFGHPPVFSCEY